MKIIHELSSYTTNKIAAGEVITEPLHVVKELLENSVDAGATKVDIQIKDNGLKSISVADNGHGIYLDDAKALFLRHATSKLKDDSDLYSISTMGFRGEALASIAAISKVDVSSRQSSEMQGFSMTQYGSKLLQLKSINRQVGTTVEVTDLFYNTPVRERFLKEQHRLRQHIADFLENFAFSHPFIKVRASLDDKVVLRTLGDGRLDHLIYEISGEAILKKLIPFDFSIQDIQFKGYLSDISLSFATTKEMRLFVNNRIISYPLIKEELLRAYEGLLPKRRFPYVLLMMQTDPSKVDVNRHPRKAEVKFSDEKDIVTYLKDNIRDVLRGKPMMVEQSISEPKVNQVLTTYEPLNVEKETPITYENLIEANSVISEIKLDDYLPEVKSQSILEEREALFDNFKVDHFIESLQYIGQVFHSFLLYEHEDKLYLLDQHAAHEKILFERFLESFENKSLQTQMLLVPITLKSHASEDALKPLASMGFELDQFGDKELIIRGIPHLFSEDEALTFLEIFLEEDRESLDLSAIITRSCKAAIKANDRLLPIEASTLLDQLKVLKDPYTCPHGRPIFIYFTRGELERRFAR